MSFRDLHKESPPKQRGKIRPKKFRWTSELAFDLSPEVPPHKECVRCKRMMPKSELEFGRILIYRRHDTKKHPFCSDARDCKKHIKKTENANRNKKTKSSKKGS